MIKWKTFASSCFFVWRRTIEARSPANKTYAQATAVGSVSCGTQTDNIPSLPPLQLLAPVSAASATTMTPTQTCSAQAPERVVAGRAADLRPAVPRSQDSRPSGQASADARLTAAAGQSAAAATAADDADAAADAVTAAAQVPTEPSQTQRPPTGSRCHSAERQTEHAEVYSGRSGSMTRRRVPTSKAGESSKGQAPR